MAVADLDARFLCHERYLRQDSVTEAVHAKTGDIPLEMAAWLDAKANENRRLQFEVNHLQARIRKLAKDPSAATPERVSIATADPSLCYAVQLPAYDKPLTWRYELQLPPDRSRRLHVRLGSVSRAATKMDENDACVRLVKLGNNDLAWIAKTDADVV